MNAIAITAGRTGLAFSLERNAQGFRAVLGLSIERRTTIANTEEREERVPISASPRPTFGLGRYIDLLV